MAAAASQFAPFSAQRAIIALAEQAGRPDSPVRRALGSGLPASTGLGPWAIERMITQFSNGWTRAAVERAVDRARRSGAKHAVPRVAVVAPANVPAAGWQAVLEPLLAGCTVVVRPSRREPVGIHNLVHALRIVDPALAERCEIGGPIGSAPAAWQAWLTGAGTLTAQGSDAAMSAVRDQALASGWRGLLRLHGEMRSLAVIDRAAWLTRGALLARQLAADTLEVDGRGCMSLRTLVWIGLSPSELGQAHEQLAGALAALADRDGAGLQAAAGRVHYQLQTLQTLEALGAPLRVTARQDGWLASATAVEPLASVWPGPGGRSLVALSLADLQSFLDLAASWRGKISTVATTLTRIEKARLIAVLSDPRTCRPGQMQAPRPDQVHDGWAPLQGFFAID